MTFVNFLHRARTPRIQLLALLLGLGAALVHANAAQSTTDWDVRPSIAYDAICVLNVLSADPYYLEYYKAEYDRLAPQLRAEERTAFANLKHRIKDQNGGIISANLALVLSAANPETLGDLIHIIDDSSAMKRNLQATSYYSDEDWKLYEDSRADLRVAFHALERIHFEDDWKKTALPKIETARASIAADLPKYNIVPVINAALGDPRPSNRITVYLLYYSQPHGIKITGTRFITHYSYPFRIVLRNAIHEMMHPPYDPAHDPELRADLDSLAKDLFFKDKLEHHDPSFGYNTLDGLAEEDCVQALEEVISEKFGQGHDVRAYWREQDAGIHVFAVAIYSLMKDEHFGETGEAFPAFLKRMFREGKFAKGNIELLNSSFFRVPTTGK